MAAVDVVATVEVASEEIIEEIIADEIPEGHLLAKDGWYYPPEAFANGEVELADEAEATEEANPDEAEAATEANPDEADAATEANPDEAEATEEAVEATQETVAVKAPATPVSALLNQIKLLRVEVAKLQQENKELKARLGNASSSSDEESKAPKAKKAPTAYNLYVREQTPIIKAAHPELKPKDVLTLIGANWRADKGITTPPRVKTPKVKTEKAADAPKKKRGPNACNLFVQAELAKMKDVKMSQTDKFKAAMEKWKQTDQFKANQAKKAATA